jgi:hypothetical protein
MLARIITVLVTAITLSGCTPIQWLLPPLLWMGVVVDQTGAPPSGPTVEVELLLTYGQTVTLPEMGLTLTFQEVLEDSRCPADVFCAWSGWVRIALVAQAEGEPPATLEITAFTDSDGNTTAPTGSGVAQPFVSYRNHHLTLVQVTPYPARHDALPALAEYQIRLAVRAEVGRHPAAPTPVAGGVKPAAAPGRTGVAYAVINVLAASNLVGLCPGNHCHPLAVKPL